MQRQIALNRQNSKTQSRVISLLQGNNSILKQLPGTPGATTSISPSVSVSTCSGRTPKTNQNQVPNTVLLKLGSNTPGSSTSCGRSSLTDVVRASKSGISGTVPLGIPGQRSAMAKPGTSRSTSPVSVAAAAAAAAASGRPGGLMMTPSVSIAPVTPGLPNIKREQMSDSGESGGEEMDELMAGSSSQKHPGKAKGKGKKKLYIFFI